VSGPWRITSGQPAPEAVARLLALLPTWFGIESSNAGYVETARTVPAYLAWPAADPAAAAAGVLLPRQHFPVSAEIYLMAVDPAWHRHGAGRALVTALEADLVATGTRFLQVKTLGPSHPDPGYALTRRFYAAAGFEPLEEIPDLWPENPCLIMIKSLPGPGRDR
jgi:ribosomal protein S18 acetylase RimI-like enzyme